MALCTLFAVIRFLCAIGNTEIHKEFATFVVRIKQNRQINGEICLIQDQKDLDQTKSRINPKSALHVIYLSVMIDMA